MDTSLSQLVTNMSVIDETASYDRGAEIFVDYNTQPLVKDESVKSIEFISSGNTFKQLLEKLEIYHECVSVANVQLIQNIKASNEIGRQFVPIKRQEEIEIYRSSIILIYNNMIGAILYRAQKLKMGTINDSSFSTQYFKIIENAIQSSIAVTSQLLDFSLLLYTPTYRSSEF